MGFEGVGCFWGLSVLFERERAALRFDRARGPRCWAGGGEVSPPELPQGHNSGRGVGSPECQRPVPDSERMTISLSVIGVAPEWA